MPNADRRAAIERFWPFSVQVRVWVLGVLGFQGVRLCVFEVLGFVFIGFRWCFQGFRFCVFLGFRFFFKCNSYIE